jgi:hypothetical protein
MLFRTSPNSLPFGPIRFKKDFPCNSSSITEEPCVLTQLMPETIVDVVCDTGQAIK